MDQSAHLLFDKGLEGEFFRQVIKNKVTALKNKNDGKDVFKGFYTEEVEHSNLSCLKLLQDSLPIWAGNNDNFKIIGLFNPWSFDANLKDKRTGGVQNFTAAEYIDSARPPVFMHDWYPFQGPCGDLMPPSPYIPDNLTLTVNTSYPSGLQADITAFLNTLTEDYDTYNTYLQNVWDKTADTLKYFQNVSNTNSLDFHFVPQVHTFAWGNWCQPGQREPLNAEISVQYYMALCYGAKGILPYSYESGYGIGTETEKWFGGGGTMSQYSTDLAADFYVYSIGISDFTESSWWGFQKRTQNFYNENKWDYIVDINSRISKWGPVLVNSAATQGYSVSRSGANHEFISDILSIDPHQPFGTQNPCVNDYQTGDYITGPYFDCPEERYWEMGFFSTTEPNVKYLMMVNRRCVPEDGGYEGDDRVLRIKFDQADLPGAVNWKIFDVLDSRTSVVFNKNSGNYVTLGETNGGMGWFEPGEAKLFKLIPALRSGGILVADEHISGQSFTCEDTVISNGFDITIDEGSVISFTDSATIIMNGGKFTSGVHGTGSSVLVTYKGIGSGKWNGLRFNESDVNIYNSKFQDIASPCVNYAISMVDCQFADIRTNQFVLNTDTAGAVQSVYIEDPFGSPSYTGLHINYNSITMANSRGNAIAVQGFSGITLPLYAGNNTMTSNGYATGILLSTITGGVVKNNSITGFSTGINTLFSTIDVYGNTISNTSSVSKGIIATGLSSSGLLPASGLWLGGMNTITNTSGVSTNIEVNNSVFALEGGNNTFDVTSTSGAYHLYGTFWDSSYNNKQRYNCFKLGGSAITSPTNPNYSISIGFAALTLNFIDYTCDATPPEDVTIVDLGNGLYDTIPYTGGGEGGAGSINNEQLTISNKSKSKSKAVGSKKGVYILSNSALYDSIRIQIRKKNYNAAKESCYDLIDTYPDSSESISALSYLFLSQTTADTTQTAIGNLKSYYEGLILNHGNNTAMVTMCNYLVQKCKVKLYQYTSALSGFQEIINNNPYSYEGLLAKWDYMATSLLVQGQGGGMSSIAELEDEEYSDDDDTPQSRVRNPKSGNERSPFSKEERQTIRQSVVFANERVKNDREAKIKTLEERSKSGDVGSEKELRTLRVLKDINKSVKPSNVFEHINIVSGDIQKVFATDVVISTKQENLIPTAFSLSQNYPNPFNPVTTIKYALPHDVKVVVRIYDILGREVKVLVNELQKAGYYDAKFDGSNFASGVYFYRIEAGDFVLAKKMVLVK